MKKIPLTQGKFALVDDEDFDSLTQHKWHVTTNGYAVRKTKGTGNKRQCEIIMHRILNKTPDGLETDHINGDRLDNRKCNLRTVTLTQNQHNSTKRKGTSKYKGVSWSKKTNKWLASITFEKKQRHLGLFSKEEDAAYAYNSSAKNLYGEFAKLNVV